jgi:hypothetical protein
MKILKNQNRRFFDSENFEELEWSIVFKKFK